MLAGRTHHCMELWEGYVAIDLNDNKTATGAWAVRIVLDFVHTEAQEAVCTVSRSGAFVVREVAVVELQRSWSGTQGSVCDA